VMDRQLDHLVRLVDDLLDVSRISQGKIVLKKERVAIAEIIQSAVEASRPLMESDKHELFINVPAHPMWVDGDRTRLAQVVGNLLNNAAKYTPSEGAISLEARQQDGEVIITVADNGMGIPAAMQTNIFEMFIQVGEHVARSQGGLGIGLALVKQLVTMHGGSVTVASEGENAGSRFTIRLPLLVEDTDELNGPLPERSENAGPQLKILVVDDNVDVAETVGWLLNEMGHVCRLVHDGRLAREAAHEFEPDAVLLDIGMPMMDGYAVCRAFRQDTALQKLPIIAQTGWGQDNDRAETAKAGFDYHIVKPIGYRDLEQVLATLTQVNRAELER